MQNRVGNIEQKIFQVFPPLGSDVPALVLPCHASSRKEMRILAPKEVLTLPCELQPPPREDCSLEQTRRTVSLSDVDNTPESLFLYSGNNNVHELYDRIDEKLKKAVEELAVVK
ncbi:hypothetical protein Tco_0671289 [Tanacetum coccineum]